MFCLQIARFSLGVNLKVNVSVVFESNSPNSS